MIASPGAGESNGFRAHTKRGLAYGQQIFSYGADDKPRLKITEYETDLVIIELRSDGSWIPRIVVETKLRSISTHDALTYSAKAASHKQIYPYLRYGLLIGALQEPAIPWRLFKHGDHFDLLAAWRALTPSEGEWRTTIELLRQQVEASQLIEQILLRAKDARPTHTFITKNIVALNAGR